MTLLLNNVFILLKVYDFLLRIVHPEFDLTFVPLGQWLQAAAVGGSRYDC